MQFQERSVVERAYMAIIQPKIKDIPFFVTDAEHRAELESISEAIQYEKFFFVINRFTKSVEHIHGLNRWMGYDESTFDLMSYFESIHPAQLNFLIPLAEEAFKIAEKPDFKLVFRNQQYIIDVVMRHKEGHYVQCKRSLTPWQWQNDGEEQILSHYLLEFTIIDHHFDTNNLDLKPRIYGKPGDKLIDLEVLLRKAASDKIENEADIFTPQEYRILRKFANNPNITSDEVAKAFRIAKSTVHTFNKKIIEKGRHFFDDKTIENAKVLAQKLRKNYWI